MNEPLQAILTVLSLVNPAICAAMFTQATGGEPFGGKMAGTTKASVGTPTTTHETPRPRLTFRQVQSARSTR